MGTAASVYVKDENTVVYSSLKDIFPLCYYDLYKCPNAYDVYKNYLNKNEDNGDSYRQMCMIMQNLSDKKYQ